MLSVTSLHHQLQALLPWSSCRALSRLEQAVATSAAPELIVVACEIKVACQRGLHLFRTYGRWVHFGKSGSGFAVYGVGQPASLCLSAPVARKCVSVYFVHHQ